MGSPLMPTAAPSGQGRGFIERNFSFAQTKLSVSQWRAAAAISRALYKLKGVRHRRERLEPAASRVLPVRFAIQLVHSQRRRLFFSELTLFAVFVVSLLVLLLLHSARIHEDWERAELLSGKLGLSTTNPLLPFNSIKDSNAMWDWVQHAFVPSVFDLPRRAGELGELQVRLLRALPSAAEDVSLGMYTWDTRDYVDGWSVPATGGSATSACDAPGEDGRPRWVGGTGCFQYRDDEFAFLRNSWLKPWGYDDYGYGGYKKLIPTSNASCADAVVRALAAHGYVDDHAVAVSFGLNVHSSRANQLTTVRVLFEFGQSGNVANSALVSSVKARMYSLGSAHDMLLLALDVLVYALICYYTAVMVGEWAHLGRLWFYDAFNLCELAISVTSIFILVYYVRFLREHKRATVADTWRTTDISALPFTYDSLFSTMAVTLMLCILKCFKYLKLEPSMMRVFDLVYEAAADLTSFLLLFGLLVVAFAMVGHFSFGRSVGAFHSPGESIITCMRFTIGDVDYDSIKQANPTLAPIFVLTWALVSVLVLVNVFIAILNEYYMEVKQRDKNEVKHRADSTTSALLGSKGAAGRMLRAPVSSVVGDRVWSVIVRLAVLKLRVHPRQDPVSVAEQDTVLVLNQFGEPAGLHRANRDVLTRRSADGRIVRVQLKRVVVSHNITRWVKEADELRVSGTPAVLRVDAVHPYGCVCTATFPGAAAGAERTSHARLSPEGSVATLRSGMNIELRQFQSRREDRILIGLLALIRWRLIELDRAGQQVVTTTQLLDMVTVAMVGRRLRTLYIAESVLRQHISEQGEKREAKRLMALRAERDETTELDRLYCRELVFEQVVEIMLRYGIEDRAHKYMQSRAGSISRPPFAPPPLLGKSASSRQLRRMSSMGGHDARSVMLGQPAAVPAAGGDAVVAATINAALQPLAAQLAQLAAGLRDVAAEQRALHARFDRLEQQHPSTRRSSADGDVDNDHDDHADGAWRTPGQSPSLAARAGNGAMAAASAPWMSAAPPPARTVLTPPHSAAPPHAQSAAPGAATLGPAAAPTRRTTALSPHGSQGPAFDEMI